MRNVLFAAAIVAVACAALPSVAAAPTISASDAWARPTPPGAVTGAVYVVLHNRGPADTLVSASSPAAEAVEFHNMTMAGGIMRMSPVTNLPVAKGGALRFAPGGMHVMLTGLKAPLKVGARVRVVFAFAKAGKVTVDAPVQNGAPAAEPMAGMKM